jgi:hypothetical protein
MYKEEMWFAFLATAALAEYMGSCLRRSAGFEKAGSEQPPRLRQILIPIRVVPVAGVPVEIMIPIIRMMPSVVAPVPVIGVWIFAIDSYRNTAGRINWLDSTPCGTE